MKVNETMDKSQIINSELLVWRKIGCNRNVRNCVNKTEFGRIVLNLFFISLL
jgi:hypothetical protein